MAIKNVGYGGKRPIMTDRSRIVVYLDDQEKDEVENAAYNERQSVSSFAASAVLREARRRNLEVQLAEMQASQRAPRKKR